MGEVPFWLSTLSIFFDILLFVFLIGMMILCVTLSIIYIKLGDYVHRLQMEMPLTQWISFDDIAARGYNKSLLAGALTFMYDRRVVETKIRDDLRRDDLLDVEDHGFYIGTAHCYEYRRIPRRGRRRRTLSWAALREKLFPTPVPAPMGI